MIMKWGVEKDNGDDVEKVIQVVAVLSISWRWWC
jgi:hypothetical protein